ELARDQVEIMAALGFGEFSFRHPSLPSWSMRLQAYRYSRLGVEKKPQTGHFSSEISVTLHQDTCSVTSGAGVHVRAGERAGQPKRPHSARVLSPAYLPARGRLARKFGADRKSGVRIRTPGSREAQIFRLNRQSVRE